MSVIASELNFQQKTSSHPTYAFENVYANHGANLTVSGGEVSFFKLPRKVLNLAKSTINFTITPEAVVDNFNFFHLNGLPFWREIALISMNSTVLAEVKNLNRYTNMTTRHTNEYGDVKTWDTEIFQGLFPRDEHDPGSYNQIEYIQSEIFEPPEMPDIINAAGSTVLNCKAVINNLVDELNDVLTSLEVQFLAVDPIIIVAFDAVTNPGVVGNDGDVVLQANLQNSIDQIITAFDQSIVDGFADINEITNAPLTILSDIGQFTTLTGITSGNIDTVIVQIVANVNAFIVRLTQNVDKNMPYMKVNLHLVPDINDLSEKGTHRRNDGNPFAKRGECIYKICGITNNSASPSLPVSLPLGIFKELIFGVNKDMYFGDQEVVLRITWNSPKESTFISDDNSTHALVLAGAAEYDGNLTVTNLSFKLAIEKNPIIINEIKNNVLTGMIIPTLFVNSFFYATTTQNHVIKNNFNRGYGEYLQKIYSGVYPTGNDAIHLSTYNRNGRVVDFYANINDVKTNPYTYFIANKDDYKDQFDKLRGSAILSSSEFYSNWIQIEDFVQTPYYQNNSNLIDGLDLERNVKFDLHLTLANADNSIYSYAITSRKLQIFPNLCKFI